jgi:very-short-patch-repair endonuclease
MVKRVVEEERELCTAASQAFPSWPYARDVADNPERLGELGKALRHHLTKNRLANVWAAKERFQKVLEGRAGRVIDDIRRFLSETLGNPEIEDARMQAQWSALMATLSHVLALGTHLTTVRDVCGAVEASGAPQYARSLKQPLAGTVDSLLPDSWRKAWRLRRLASYLESIDAQEELKRLAKSRHEVAEDLSRAYRDIVVKRTWLKLAENASPSIRAALEAYRIAIQKIGKDKGRGKRAVRYRQDARTAASQANKAVPCWIMPHYRVSESLPAELGCFDLVVIDEASQSDLMALPSLLRATKVLIVGDDKQVSPEGVGLEEEKIRSLMSRFLGNQVGTYRPQMAPNNSIYDLFNVVFAKSAVMLKEHFRCVGPIIEYSKREFYRHELRPLRMPKASERLDPPLIDVLVEDGYSAGHVNAPEARFIVDEIKAIAADPNMRDRSIGVVSLLADKQAMFIWERLTDELGPELMLRHRIACGDARTFQGKERDIMFLSMVSAPNEVGGTLSGMMYEQRFNVAASRARDRMYLVRSVEPDHLSAANQLRRGLIAHFAAPFAQNEVRVEDLRKLCESPFEREMYDELTQRGYWVTPQVRVGQYRIDMVIEGHNDARLAVECDGDKYHGADKWADDMQRQRVLERAGWVFWRCFASAFVRRRVDVLGDLVRTLAERGIEPIGAEGAPRSVHTEHRVVSSNPQSTKQDDAIPAHVAGIAQAPILVVHDQSSNSGRESVPLAEAPNTQSVAAADSLHGRERLHASVKSCDGNLPVGEYVVYSGSAGRDPRSVNMTLVSEGIVRIVDVEGPMLAKRAYDIYLRGCGILRMGHELKSTMNKALAHAIHQGRLVSENEANHSDLLFSVIRVHGTPAIRLRSRGPRAFEEIPPSELQVVARHLIERHGFSSGSDEHLRAVLECFDLKRLTTQVSAALLEILERRFLYVDEFITRIPVGVPDAPA